MLIHAVCQKFLTLPPHPNPPLITIITIINTTSKTITIIISFIRLIYLTDSLTSPL